MGWYNDESSLVSISDPPIVSIRHGQKATVDQPCGGTLRTIGRRGGSDGADVCGRGEPLATPFKDFEKEEVSCLYDVLVTPERDPFRFDES